MNEESRELLQEIHEMRHRMEALEAKMDDVLSKVDQSVERWTWDRYERIRKELLPQIDKGVERWTWERYTRMRRNLREQGWNLLYTMNPEAVKPVRTNTEYDIDFFMEIRYGSVQSAEAILSRVFNYLPHKSVVDFGCGTGTWLWVAKAFGAQKVLGIDGTWVPKNLLMIDEQEFLPANLEAGVSVPHKFDLAISVECAEHLSPNAADGFVASLCKASDIILYSAAHPGQGGEHHVNEQPMTYWGEKFQQHGFLPIHIRSTLPQNDPRILWWYRDNIILFVKRDVYDSIVGKIEKC